MNAPHTRVGGYLDELSRMLVDLDPATRDDVLAGVREHLDATLEAHPDDPRAVDEALVRLGPAERIAAEARADRPTAPVGAAPAPGLPHRGWLVAGLCLTLLSTVPFTVVTAIGRLLERLATDRAGFPSSFPLLHGPVEMAFLGWPLWVAGVVTVVVARRRMPRSWGVLLACGPIALSTVAIGTFWREPQGVSAVVSVVLLVAATALVVAAAVQAWREAPAA